LDNVPAGAPFAEISELFKGAWVSRFKELAIAAAAGAAEALLVLVLAAAVQNISK
jgi:hypothetical protein